MTTPSTSSRTSSHPCWWPIPWGRHVHADDPRSPRHAGEVLGRLLARALKIAERAMRVLDKGFTQEACQQMARILYEETGVGAVAITDREKLLAFIGIGEDHHLPNRHPTQPHLQGDPAAQRGWSMPTTSSPTAATCIPSATNSSLVIPLRGKGVGGGHHQALRAPALILLLHQPHPGGSLTALRPDLAQQSTPTSRKLAAGPSRRSKLLQAQISPLSVSAPSTPGGGDPRDPEDARTLVHHLSTFFRRNLKRQGDG